MSGQTPEYVGDRPNGVTATAGVAGAGTAVLWYLANEDTGARLYFNEMSIALGIPAVMLFAQASAIAAGRLTLAEANAELTSVLDQDERYFNVTVTHKEKKGKSGITNEAETQVDVDYKLTPYTYIAG